MHAVVSSNGSTTPTVCTFGKCLQQTLDVCHCLTSGCSAFWQRVSVPFPAPKGRRLTDKLPRPIDCTVVKLSVLQPP